MKIKNKDLYKIKTMKTDKLIELHKNAQKYIDMSNQLIEVIKEELSKRNNNT